MSVSEIITTAVAETCLPEGCKACQRKGLPILLLRKAMVPDAVTQFHEPLNGDAPLRASAGLRTLRTGYLYVLLDRKHWQAYEVTPQAALRRFNPYQPYLGEPTPLPTRCVHENHEIPSSFLMLDDKRYSSALLAFANDPWPSSVLDAYKDGRAPLKRFQALDLKAAREDPASVGMAITEKQEVISQSVFEYVQYNSGPWDSVHGFHSQRSRMHHLLRYTTNAEREHKLKNGVLAFVLNDFVGLIQESNAQRLAWVARRQAWRENPELAYQLLTSQCLLAIRASHRPRADMEARDFKPMMADGSPVFLDPEVERQLVIKQNAEGFDKRLEERYDEKKRARFQARYDRIEARFQALIGSFTADYVIACNFRGFNTLQQFDYDPADERSRLDYTKTMARCLRGGITDPPRTSDEQPLGPSEQLWHKWLSDPDSPAFRALTLSDTNLLGGLLPSFTADEATDWKDSVKLYAAVAALIGSKEGQLWLRDPVRANIAQVLSAINGAAARLDRHLGMGAHRAISYLNVAGQALHNGVRLIELKVSMSVAAYYAVQSQQIRQAYNAASEALPKPPAYWPANNIRPIILGGVLSLAALDPTAGSKLISVSVWVSGNAEELQRSLQAGARVGADLTKAGFSSITVVGGILDANGRALLNGVRINATQAAGLLADSLRGLRGAATSSAVLLGVGSLYLLNDMLKKNLQAVELAIGPKKGEAIIALAGTGLALLGGSVQVLGALMASGAKPTGFEKLGQAGEWLAKRGAFISAAVGFVDAAQAVTAGTRSLKSGEGFAAALYGAAGFLSSVSGAFGMYAALYSTAFVGPLGLAVVLGLIAYGFYKWAESNESNALERWARRCYFGNAGESPNVHWDSPSHADVAIAELNAAILGIEVALTVEAVAIATGPSPFFRTPSYIDNIRFAIKIPGYNPQTSAYFWKLTLHRDIDIRKNEIAGGVAIARQDFHASALSQEVMTDSMTPLQIEALGNTFEVDEPIKIIKQLSAADGNTFYAMIISGGATRTSDTKFKKIVAATFSLIYWPDRDQPDSFAHIIRVEQA